MNQRAKKPFISKAERLAPKQGRVSSRAIPGNASYGGGFGAGNGGSSLAEVAAAVPKVISRDEMNLSEFPLTVLSTRTNNAVKTLEFKDSIRGKNGETIQRAWIITGADKFGLPTSSDDEVLLGLLKLTVDQGFEERKIFFSRYELLKNLRWSTEGRSYQRLQKALDRLSGVRIKATNAFYDNDAKAHSTKNFGIIDAYEINDGRDEKRSFFAWSEVIFKSFQSGFIKKLDLDFYLNLKSATAKRLYRFLDKHFWYRSRVNYNLFVLAHEKIGISRTYQYASLLKQQLEPALEELKACNFIDGYVFSGRGEGSEITIDAASRTPRSVQLPGQQPSPRSEQDGFSNGPQFGGTSSESVMRGKHEDSSTATDYAKGIYETKLNELKPKSAKGITEKLSPYVAQSQTVDNLSVSSAITSSGSSTSASSYPIVAEALMARGIKHVQLGALISHFDNEALKRCEQIVEYFDMLVSQNSPKVSRSPIGFLYTAIKNQKDFTLPKEAKAAALSSAQASKSAFHKQQSFDLQQKNTQRLQASNAEAARKATYLKAREKRAEELKSEVEGKLLTKLHGEVEQSFVRMKGALSEDGFKRVVEQGVEERLLKLFLFPTMEEYFKSV